jgi:hypothetical protein
MESQFGHRENGASLIRSRASRSRAMRKLDTFPFETRDAQVLSHESSPDSFEA